MIEVKNPLTKCVVMAEGVSAKTYGDQVAKRGEPNYVMSRGDLQTFMECPSRWRNGFESEGSKSTEWGTLIDALVMDPDGFTTKFCVTPETYQDAKTGDHKPWNWNANVCKAWLDEQGDKEPIKGSVKRTADAAVAALYRDQRIRQLLFESAKQVMVRGCYVHEETGVVVPLKGLIDLVPDVDGPYGRSLADLKTCSTAHPRPWTRSVFDHWYHVQAALYLDMYCAATGEERIEFLHVLQESVAPWQTGRRLLAQDYLELGRMTYISALDRYARCIADNYWPDYDDDSRNSMDGWQLTSPEAWMVTSL